MLRREHEAALEAGAVRRAASLAGRAERLAASERAAVPAQLPSRGREREAVLDGQARLPAARERARPGSPRRDYGLISALAGLPLGAYATLGPGEQRATRLAIDRELDRRRGAGVAAPEFAPRLPLPPPHDAGGREPDRGQASPARRPPGRRTAGESPVIRRERQFAEARARRTDPEGER